MKVNKKENCILFYLLFDISTSIRSWTGVLLVDGDRFTDDAVCSGERDIISILIFPVAVLSRQSYLPKFSIQVTDFTAEPASSTGYLVNVIS